MRNLVRLTYAANKAQAWEDWEAIATEAENMGKFGLVCGLEPDPKASIKTIDKAISLIRSALESSDPNWTFVLPSARAEGQSGPGSPYKGETPNVHQAGTDRSKRTFANRPTTWRYSLHHPSPC